MSTPKQSRSSAVKEINRRLVKKWPEGVYAATWDSSFFVSPSGGRRYHVAVLGAPACNQALAVLDEENKMLLEDVPDVLRCMKPGCRQRWPNRK